MKPARVYCLLKGSRDEHEVSNSNFCMYAQSLCMGNGFQTFYYLIIVKYLKIDFFRASVKLPPNSSILTQSSIRFYRPLLFL